MSNDIKQIIKERDDIKRATDSGTKTHALLSQVVIDEDKITGDISLVNKIQSVPTLAKFFGVNSRVEVPIAGFLNNRFVSRRIDRLVIEHETQTISILDYKTDTDHNALIDSYKVQLQEYAKLVGQIYPNYKINKFILWTHDWMLERV